MRRKPDCRWKKNNRNICEVTIPIEGGIVRAEESAEDMFKAIDRCLEKLERQIRKYRTKLEKRLKDGAFAAAPEYFTETEGDEEIDEKELVRTKTFRGAPDGGRGCDCADAAAGSQLLRVQEPRHGQRVRGVCAPRWKLRSASAGICLKGLGSRHVARMMS